MKHFIVILVAIVLVLALGTFGVLQTKSLKALELENEELQKGIAELQNNDSTNSGGAETVPNEPQMNVESNLVFPIAEEDFLFYTSPYGLRVSPILNVEMKHEGLDIAGVWKSQVVSVADGVVIEHWPPPDGYFKGHNIYGGLIVVEHEDSKSLYGHLSWTRVHQGMEVAAGEVLGRIGNTGMADGNHLHFELIIEDETVNPLLYLPKPE